MTGQTKPRVPGRSKRRGARLRTRCDDSLPSLQVNCLANSPRRSSCRHLSELPCQAQANSGRSLRSLEFVPQDSQGEYGPNSNAGSGDRQASDPRTVAAIWSQATAAPPLRGAVARVSARAGSRRFRTRCGHCVKPGAWPLDPSTSCRPPGNHARHSPATPATASREPDRFSTAVRFHREAGRMDELSLARPRGMEKKPQRREVWRSGAQRKARREQRKGSQGKSFDEVHVRNPSGWFT